MSSVGRDTVHGPPPASFHRMQCNSAAFEKHTTSISRERERERERASPNYEKRMCTLRATDWFTAELLDKYVCVCVRARAKNDRRKRKGVQPLSSPPLSETRLDARRFPPTTSPCVFIEGGPLPPFFFFLVFTEIRRERERERERKSQTRL